jgi:hypothetical protein
MLETLTTEREFEILHSTNDKAEAIDELISYSNRYEDDIVSGKYKVYMTTFLED